MIIYNFFFKLTLFDGARMIFAHDNFIIQKVIILKKLQDIQNNNTYSIWYKLKKYIDALKR